MGLPHLLPYFRLAFFPQQECLFSFRQQGLHGTSTEKEAN